MFERILVAVDGSAPAKRAFDLALDVAKAQKAKLYALHVIDERALGIGLVASGYVAPAYVEGLIDGLRKVGKKILVGVQRRAKASGPVGGPSVRPRQLPATTRIVVSGGLGTRSPKPQGRPTSLRRGGRRLGLAPTRR